MPQDTNLSKHIQSILSEKQAPLETRISNKNPSTRV